MAIYHLAYKHASRAKGYSAKAHADYILRQGRYGRGAYREQLLHAEHHNMPAWAADDPRHFWHAADCYERANGRLYTEIEVALPRELNQAQQTELVREFVAQQIGDQHPVTWAMHNSHALDGEANPHVHIMFSERLLDGVDRSETQFFKRANSKAPERGGAPKHRQWQERDKLLELRESWADTLNRSLAQHGLEARVDHRSLEVQGIDREPEWHMGRDLTAMVRRGAPTELGAKIIELRAYRERLGQVERQIGETRGQLIDLEKVRQARQVRQMEQAQSGENQDHSGSVHEGLKPVAQPDGSPASPRLWEQQLERLLPDDLPTLQSLWESACRRRFEQVRDKAQGVIDKVRSQLARHHEQHQAHREGEPQRPTGMWSRFQQKRYERERRVWHQQAHKLHRRGLQLHKRLKHVMAYSCEGLRPFGGYASKGEALAEKHVRAERPELARKLDQTRAQVHQQSVERTRKEAEQRRQQEHERGLDRGLKR